MDYTNELMGSWNVTKPHLRLHYEPKMAYDNARIRMQYPWSMEYVRGDSKRLRRITFQHETSAGALQSARVLWFPDWDRRRYAKE